MKPLTASGLLLAVLAGAAAAAEPADHLFVGEHIITMEADYPDLEARPTALAVQGEKIVWLGDAADAGEWTGPETVRHDLGDRALLPGFIDAHGHLTFLAATIAWANLASPPVGPVTDLTSLQDELRNYIEENAVPPGDWVIGNGYDDSLLKETRHPDRAVLDAVSTEHPIALLHVSGHLMAANSAALKAAGIDAETTDPSGGYIRRYPGGTEPNGVLEETATYALRAILQHPRGNPLEDLTAALDRYASYGVTTAQDGAIAGPAIGLLETAAADGLLDLDVVMYPVVAHTDLSVLEGKTVGTYRNRLKVGGVKMVLDGSPQGKTAWLSQPYHVPPTGQAEGYAGYPIHADEHAAAMVKAFMGAGVPILAHANGDAAAGQLIDSVAASGAADTDHRTVMIHAQTVRDDQLDRMKTLGLVPSFFSTHTFFWGDWHRDSVLGPERGARISPTRSAMNRGIPFTVHNDAPIVPPDMIRLLWATTNRETRSGKVLGADQRLTTFEALSAMTRMAAYQYFEEDQKGTLTVGKQADLVVLSATPLSSNASDLLSISIVSTWSRGAKVFGP
jgi:predicted amidohydrolase YtcJ